MKYRKLGNTDIDVSLICLGTMNWGVQNTEADAHEQMDYAVDHGVNFFDTAEFYPIPPSKETQGLTEEYIGTWLKKTGKREDIILATKIVGPGAGTKYIRPDNDFSAQTIVDAVDGSLKRLQTDYIDLYQIHWPARKTNYFGVRDYRHFDGWEDNILEILQGLDAQVKAGKIRHIGISNETPWGLSRYMQLAEKHNLPRCMSVQNPYNLLNRTYEIGLAEMSIRDQAGLLAYSPMAFGLLSGKYHDGRDVSQARITLFDRMSRYKNQKCQDATVRYMEIAKKYNITTAEMALAFINQQPFVTANIIGATTMEQLKENIGSVNIELPKECIKEINAVHDDIPNPAP